MTANSQKSGDPLLLIGAGIVASMGVAWLLIAAPWSGPEPAQTGEAAAAEPQADAAAIEPSDIGGRDAVESGASADSTNPLRMAELALEAGMLIEPESYSAWALFAEAASADPENTRARDGLERVAEALLNRGRSAFEQGRYDDADAIAATIIDRLPDHAGARRLAADTRTATTAPEPEPEPERAAADVAEPEPAVPADAIPEMHAAFIDAMSRNAVLAPANANARDIVFDMLEIAPAHELAESARSMLVTELLDRSVQSIEALDVAAARTWVESAEPLAVDPNRIEQAYERITDHIIETESMKRLPISALEMRRYVPPDYPETALNREIEGWVDIDFVVSVDGHPEEITVTDASHTRYFREEAIAAVTAWEFEPVIFMDRAIPRRTYTRLEFVLD